MMRRGIYDPSDTRKLGRKFSEKLHVLSEDLDRWLPGQSGDVASGARQG
jgi:hypothetical protein